MIKKMKRKKIAKEKYLRVLEWLLEILELRKERNQDLRQLGELHNLVNVKNYLFQLLKTQFLGFFFYMKLYMNNNIICGIIIIRSDICVRWRRC